MIHALIYHGFSLKIPAGRKERNLYHDIINQIDVRWPQNKNLVINGTWLNWDFQFDCDALLKSYQPDQVFICSMGDPWEMDQWAQNKFPQSKLFFLGNMDSQYHFNFWSFHFLEQAPIYSENEIWLSDLAKLYLCYQNKPHEHRQIFTHELFQKNLLDFGHVTLQGPTSDFKYPSLVIRSDPDSPNGGHFEDIGLGNLDIWNSCYINIVSETVWRSEGQVFVSEKTWKPILGMRPFIINGDPRIYDYLEKHGFDTFNDIFPVDQLRKSNNISQMVNIIIDFLDRLKNTSSQNLKSQWLDILPRLRYNRDRMLKFAEEQNYRVHHLFEEIK